jgi:hypothetical protein
MALCFCLLPHPSAIFSSIELAPMPLGVLVIICTVQSPLGQRQAHLMSQQLFSSRNTSVPYESSCIVIWGGGGGLASVALLLDSLITLTFFQLHR